MDLSSKEFLNTLEALNSELCLLKSDQSSLKFQISNFFEENSKLTQELKQNVYERNLDISGGDVVLLQKKYEAAVAAKNAVIEMWQTALRQIEHQEELLLGKKSIVETERNESEKQFSAMKNDYLKGLTILSDELSALQTELSQTKNLLSKKTSDLNTCQAKLDTVSKKLDFNKDNIIELEATNKNFQEQIKSLKSLLENSNRTLDAFTTELTALKKENGNLMMSVSHLKVQNQKMKAQVVALEKDAKDSLLMAQEAVLKKKEIIFKEEQYQKVIETLKSSIDFEIQKASMKYKAELKEMQKKSAEKIQTLMLEIQQLHQEITEQQNMFERANREKQALESKLELLFSESSSSMPISSSAFDDLCQRLTMAERSRDELELKASSLDLSIKDLKSAKEQEIQFLLEKQLSLKKRVQNLTDDFNQASADRIRFSDEVTKLRKKCYELEQELKTLRNKHSQDISALQKESSNRLQAMQERHHIKEGHYKNACIELQHLLQAEFKVSHKWRDEVENLIFKSETMITELVEEISQLKHNNSELIKILHLNNVSVPRQVMHIINNL